MNPSARDRFLALLRQAVLEDTLVKLTLGKPAGADPTLRNLYLRPVLLKSGPRYALVWRHPTKDVTKNLVAADALRLVESMIGSDFQDAHLFSETQTAHLETGKGKPSLKISAGTGGAKASGDNDQPKVRAIDARTPWLRALGVTDEKGRPVSAMADKFRQIEKFAELLGHLLREAPLPADRRLRVYDMGCGKGYLTFAASEMLGERAEVCGVEARGELVDLGNRLAGEQGFGDRLSFRRGTISDTPIDSLDILIALHACDTATDDALAKGITGGASLLVVAPCCQKEIRPQIEAPPVLSLALRHGIFEERQAEFVTDALRAQLLEWAGYRTRVMEFISTEHTAKNTMITAVKGRKREDPELAGRIRAFAAFYGVKRQALADHLGFSFQ